MEPAAWIAFAALLITIASLGGGTIWKLATNRAEIIDRITVTKDSVDSDISGLYKRIDQAVENARRDLEAAERRGVEPIFAIREKVAQVELFIRDHFVSKREYEKDHAQLLLAIREMQDSLMSSQDRMRVEIEKRLDMYEERMEKVIMSRS